MHQPALFITPTFCREVYLARIFDVYLSLSMNFACMLGPCGPKKAPFCFHQEMQLLRSQNSGAGSQHWLCLCPGARCCTQPHTETAKTISWRTNGLLTPAKKICKAWVPYKMTIKINKVIPYKMDGPNPAKFSNRIVRLLYDSVFIPKSSILLLLQYGKVQVGSLQNGLWNGPWGPSN